MIRERDATEEQMEINLRAELKTKRLEEKAHSMRHMAIQAEEKQKLKKAINFHRKELLIRYGIGPWMRFIDQRR
jgi:uncharacterized membrane protein